VRFINYHSRYSGKRVLEKRLNRPFFLGKRGWDYFDLDWLWFAQMGMRGDT